LILVGGISPAHRSHRAHNTAGAILLLTEILLKKIILSNISDIKYQYI